MIVCPCGRKARSGDAAADGLCRRCRQRAGTRRSALTPSATRNQKLPMYRQPGQIERLTARAEAGLPLFEDAA
jgi:hypothetical protein